MALMRSLLLAASQNAWLRNNAEKFLFVRRSVSRFMPGETFDSALTAGQTLLKRNIGTVFTHLGENVTDRAEAESVAEHYLEVLDGIHRVNLPAEISVKLTQLGLDLSPISASKISNASFNAKSLPPPFGWTWKRATTSTGRWTSISAL